MALTLILSRLTGYLFTVAQIFNLPYRRFVIGRTLLAGGGWQVTNLRYSRPQSALRGAAGTLNTHPIRWERAGVRGFQFIRQRRTHSS